MLILDIDSLRADRLLPDQAAARAPNLAALAERGVRFDQAIAPSGWTLSSFASLVSGRHSPREVMAEHPTPAEQAASELALLPGILRAYGYTVGVGWGDTLLNNHPRSRSWFGEGARDLLDIGRLSARLGQGPLPEPFFYLLHDMDLHLAPDRAIADPLAADPATQRRAIDLYDGGLRAYDEQVGELLAALEAQDQLDNTLIVVTSDHGEELYERGRLGHGTSHYETVLRIPLLIVDPAGPRGEVVAGMALTQDVAPTILERLGIPRGALMEGISLLPAMRGEPLPERIAWSLTLDQAASYRTPTTKLLLQRTGCGDQPLAARPPLRGTQCAQLFDLATDPMERADLSAARPEQAAALEGQLLAWVSAQEPTPLGTTANFQRALQRGGYWEGGSQVSPPAMPPAQPRGEQPPGP